MKTTVYTIFILMVMTISISSQNTNPVVTNVTFSISGSTVTIHYKVTDAEQNLLKISMEASMDGGATWTYPFSDAAGDIGDNIERSENQKTITATFNGTPNDFWKIRIIADDKIGDQIYYAGKVYNTVTIGTQTWLKENLDLGTMIHSTSGGSNSNGSQTNNSIIEKYCYNNLESNCTLYGGLYQWGEAMQYSTSPGAQGLCPTGWHLPTDAEFTALRTTVGNNGNSLKAIGQGTGDGTGTNTSEFSGLISGLLNGSNKTFSDLSYVYFWGSTPTDIFGGVIGLISNSSYIDYGSNYILNGHYIRCLKNN